MASKKKGIDGRIDRLLDDLEMLRELTVGMQRGVGKLKSELEKQKSQPKRAQGAGNPRKKRNRRGVD